MRHPPGACNALRLLLLWVRLKRGRRRPQVSRRRLHRTATESPRAAGRPHVACPGASNVGTASPFQLVSQGVPLPRERIRQVSRRSGNAAGVLARESHARTACPASRGSLPLLLKLGALLLPQLVAAGRSVRRRRSSTTSWRRTKKKCLRHSFRWASAHGRY
jgi:hypothetical protein